MSYPHTIRLRGPWHFEPLARSIVTPDGQMVERADNLPPAGRGSVPSDWEGCVGRDFRGRVRYRRSFNPPGTLDSHERLWLVVEGVDAQGVISLNGIRLGAVTGYSIWASFDVTKLVGPRNEVALEVELPASADRSAGPLRPGREQLPGGPIGELRLEVRSQWFIELLAIWSLPDDDQRRFAVRGRIVGEPCATPLAVVVGGCEHELGYLEARPGEAFEMAFAAADFPAWTTDQPTTAPIEVKLLACGESVWQQVRETGFRVAAPRDNSTRLGQILQEAAYSAFDRDGTAVIQHVPPAWAESVCPRLAHHPSVVAWSAEADSTPQAPAFGRAWVH